MKQIRLGEITEQELAKALAGATNDPDACLSFKTRLKDGKTIVEVYAEIPENRMWLTEIVKQGTS